MSRTGILGQSSFQRLAVPEAKRRTRKCVICRKQFEPRNISHKACGAECALEHAAAERLRKDRQETRTRLAGLKTRADHLKTAQAAFNAFIRARDAALPCISCGRFHQGQNHAGHFLSAGAHPNLRYHEQNVWKQCQPCNTHLSGNALNYRRGLIARIGLEAVEALESDQAPRHYAIDDLKAITALYRRKLKEIAP